MIRVRRVERVRRVGRVRRGGRVRRVRLLKKITSVRHTRIGGEASRDARYTKLKNSQLQNRSLFFTQLWYHYVHTGNRPYWGVPLCLLVFIVLISTKISALNNLQVSRLISIDIRRQNFKLRRIKCV